MYNFVLTISENDANDIPQSHDMTTVTCSSVEDFEQQLRKDAELYIIRDVLKNSRIGVYSIGDEEYSRLLHKEWLPAVKKYNYSDINISLGPSGKIISLDPNTLVDSRSLYSSSPSSTQKKFLRMLLKNM